MANGAEWRIPFLTELQELGSGAQGRVVLARDDGSGEVVAVKYLAADLLTDAQARATFKAEAQMLVRVRNPHVAQLRGYVEAAGGAAIVMEAVHGQSLRRLLDERGALRAEAALAVLKGSLLGMAAAHEVGVVHRDYKPANVMVQDDGQSKLIDFGVAVLAGQRNVMGTPAYMAPEQWQGLPASPATDIYAAALVFFECVTGRVPFSATTIDGWMREHLTAPVPMDAVPGALRALVVRGTAKDPRRRFGGITEFVETLEASAAAAYGADWERRGLAALGASVALFAAAFPLGLLGGGTATGTATSAGSLAGGTGHAVGGQGVLGKVGGAKGVAAGGGTVVAGAVVIAMVLWPSSPTVGGQAQGSVRADFARPGVLLNQPNMPVAETPYVKLDYTVTPARIKPGTRVTVTQRFYSRFVWGAKYLPGGVRQCFGKDSKRNDDTADYSYAIGGKGGDKLPDDKSTVYFFRTSKAEAGRLPERSGVYVVGKVTKTNDSQPYVQADCAYHSTIVTTVTLSLPDTDEIKPGRYGVALTSPVRFSGVTRNGRSLPLESVGPRATGRLPVVTVFWD